MVRISSMLYNELYILFGFIFPLCFLYMRIQANDFQSAAHILCNASYSYAIAWTYIAKLLILNVTRCASVNPYLERESAPIYVVRKRLKMENGMEFLVRVIVVK